MAGPTQKPFTKAFACAGVALVAVVIVTLAFLGRPGNSTYASDLLGRLVAALAVAALATGFFARRSSKVWSLWRFAAIYVVALVIVVALYLSGTRGS